MSVEIILLNEANASLLTHIGAAVFDDEIRADYLGAFLKNPGHVMFLAVENEIVVGMASAVEYYHPDKPAQFWINEVGVAETHRRRGIGRSLVQALIAESKARGCIYTWLGTDEANEAGKACFGSIPEGEEPEKFLLYQWELD